MAPGASGSARCWRNIQRSRSVKDGLPPALSSRPDAGNDEFVSAGREVTQVTLKLSRDTADPEPEAPNSCGVSLNPTCGRSGSSGCCWRPNDLGGFTRQLRPLNEQMPQCENTVAVLIAAITGRVVLDLHHWLPINAVWGNRCQKVMDWHATR
jgi:hypothetical protein